MNNQHVIYVLYSTKTKSMYWSYIYSDFLCLFLETLINSIDFWFLEHTFAFFFAWDSGIQYKIVLFVIYNTLLKLWLSIWIQLFPLILFKFPHHFGLSLRVFQYINYFPLRKRYIISNFSRKFLPISIFANVLLTTSSNVCFSWVFSFVTICKFYPVYSVNFTSLKRSKQLQDMSLSARSYIHGPTWFLAQ